MREFILDVIEDMGAIASLAAFLSLIFVIGILVS